MKKIADLALGNSIADKTASSRATLVDLLPRDLAPSPVELSHPSPKSLSLPRGPLSAEPSPKQIT